MQHRKRFFSSFISEGDLVYDVGANYGNRVKPLVQVGARVVAVEPQPKCALYLLERFGDGIQIIPLQVERLLHVSMQLKDPSGKIELWSTRDLWVSIQQILQKRRPRPTTTAYENELHSRENLWSKYTVS